MTSSAGGSDSPPDPPARAHVIERLAGMIHTFVEHVPHNLALGIELLALDDSTAELKLPWRPDLVGNPETQVLHGGVITALLDACCGAAVFMALASPRPIATLDLRIDYLRPALPKEEVIARAHCYRVTRNIAFVRALAYHGDESRAIASAAASFMLGTRHRGRPKREDEAER